MAHSQIAAFARLAKENSAPKRLIAGQKTKLSRTMHDIRYDAVHDEFLVTNPFAKAIMTFRGGADGEEAPIRVIQGPATQLAANVDRLDVDPVNNEILIPNRNAILVFPRDARGDVAPKRILRGPATELRNATTVAADALNGVLVSGLMNDGGRTNATGSGGLLVFERTASGDTAPLRVIRGPKTGIRIAEQLQVYPPKGWIIITQSTDWSVMEPENVFVGVWSIRDQGDLAPRWRLAGPKTGIVKPRGVALIPKYKELVVADMTLNSVLTYSFPELF